MSAEQRRGFVLQHDMSGLDRGDLKSRMEAWKIGVESKIFSIEEVRRWEQLPSQPTTNA
jgi:hypothetical protein